MTASLLEVVALDVEALSEVDELVVMALVGVEEMTEALSDAEKSEVDAPSVAKELFATELTDVQETEALSEAQKDDEKTPSEVDKLAVVVLAKFERETDVLSKVEALSKEGATNVEAAFEFEEPDVVPTIEDERVIEAPSETEGAVQVLPRADALVVVVLAKVERVTEALSDVKTLSNVEEIVAEATSVLEELNVVTLVKVETAMEAPPETDEEDVTLPSRVDENIVVVLDATRLVLVVVEAAKQAQAL